MHSGETMIENIVELRVAVRQLRILDETVCALREQLEVSNPSLYEISSQAYFRRIDLLQREIAEYVSQHPSSVSDIIAEPRREPEAAASSALASV